jgi:hypothetical protein
MTKMTKGRELPVGSALLLAMSAAEAMSATLCVPSEYATINAALDAALLGDTVLVAPGTYTTAEVRVVDIGGPFPVYSLGFLKDGVVVESESGPEATVLDLMGQGDPSSASWVFLAALLPSQNTVVDGFTVTGSPLGWNGMWVSECGKVTVRDCIFENLDARPGGLGGGGIACGATSLVLERTVFRNCHGVEGGGVWYYEGDVAAHLQGDITVDACTFENCSEQAMLIFGDGRLPTRAATIGNCVFRGNSSINGGGAVAIGDYTLTLHTCSFFDNISSASGGAASLSCNFNIRDCLFVRNACTGNAQGGAVSAGPASAGVGSVQGCTFYGNSQQWTFSGGAAMKLSVPPGGGSFDLGNNTFVASTGSTAIYLFSGALTSSCNVLWNNTAGDVQGFTLDPTDRIVDPMFCDVTLDDFTLNEASPCLPANSLGCGQIGAFGQGCGSVSIEPTTWAKIKSMYR